MRFLVDECTGPAVAEWLATCGHEVASVYSVARGVPDAQVLSLAVEERRILITNDKGFGERVFRSGSRHHGVILLRLSDERAASKIAVLGDLLNRPGNAVEGRFVVVTERTIRFVAQPT